MTAISSWSVIICIAALCSCIMNMLSPEGSMQKIFRYALGVFLICALILPLKEINLKDFSLSLNDLSDEVPTDVSDRLSKIENDYLTGSIVSLIEECSSKHNVTPIKTEIIMDIGEDNSISITKAIMYISKNDASKKSELTNALKSELGLNTEIYLTEEENE